MNSSSKSKCSKDSDIIKSNETIDKRTSNIEFSKNENNNINTTNLNINNNNYSSSNRRYALELLNASLSMTYTYSLLILKEHLASYSNSNSISNSMINERCKNNSNTNKLSSNGIINKNDDNINPLINLLTDYSDKQINYSNKETVKQEKLFSDNHCLDKQTDKRNSNISSNKDFPYNDANKIQVIHDSNNSKCKCSLCLSNIINIPDNKNRNNCISNNNYPIIISFCFDKNHYSKLVNFISQLSDILSFNTLELSFFLAVINKLGILSTSNTHSNKNLVYSKLFKSSLNSNSNIDIDTNININSNINIKQNIKDNRCVNVILNKNINYNYYKKLILPRLIIKKEYKNSKENSKKNEHSYIEEDNNNNSNNNNNNNNNIKDNFTKRKRKYNLTTEQVIPYKITSTINISNTQSTHFSKTTNTNIIPKLKNKKQLKLTKKNHLLTSFPNSHLIAVSAFLVKVHLNINKIDSHINNINSINKIELEKDIVKNIFFDNYYVYTMSIEEYKQKFSECYSILTNSSSDSGSNIRAFVSFAEVNHIFSNINSLNFHCYCYKDLNKVVGNIDGNCGGGISNKMFSSNIINTSKNNRSVTSILTSDDYFNSNSNLNSNIKTIKEVDYSESDSDRVYTNDEQIEDYLNEIFHDSN